MRFFKSNKQEVNEFVQELEGIFTSLVEDKIIRPYAHRWPKTPLEKAIVMGDVEHFNRIYEATTSRGRSIIDNHMSTCEFAVDYARVEMLEILLNNVKLTTEEIKTLVKIALSIQKEVIVRLIVEKNNVNIENLFNNNYKEIKEAVHDVFYAIEKNDLQKLQLATNALDNHGIALFQLRGERDKSCLEFAIAAAMENPKQDPLIIEHLLLCDTSLQPLFKTCLEKNEFDEEERIQLSEKLQLWLYSQNLMDVATIPDAPELTDDVDTIRTWFKQAVDGERYGVLHWAIISKDQKIFDFLMAKQVDPNQIAKDGTTPLLLAAQLNNFYMAKVLLEQGASVVSNGQKVLNQAVSHNNDNLVFLLLNHVTLADIEDCLLIIAKANKPIQDAVFNRAMTGSFYNREKMWFAATIAGQVNILKTLYDEDNALILQKLEDNIALVHAAQNDHPQVVEFLLDKHCASKTSYEPYLFKIARTGSKACQELVLLHAITQSNIAHETLWFVAAAAGSLDSVKQLYEQNKTLLQEVESREFDYPANATMLAAANGHKELVLWLLDQGAQTIVDWDTKYTIAIHAAYKGQIEILKILKDKGIISECKKDFERFANEPLAYAAAFGRIEAVEWLLNNCYVGKKMQQAAIDKAFAEAIKSFQPSANNSEPSEIIAYLIQKGVTVVYLDNGASEESLLEKAIIKGYIETVKILLSNSQKDALTWWDTNNSFKRAITVNNPKLVKLLLEYQADPNSWRLEQAIKDNRIEIVRILFKYHQKLGYEFTLSQNHYDEITVEMFETLSQYNVITPESKIQNYSLFYYLIMSNNKEYAADEKIEIYIKKIALHILYGASPSTQFKSNTNPPDIYFSFIPDTQKPIFVTYLLMKVLGEKFDEATIIKILKHLCEIIPLINAEQKDILLQEFSIQISPLLKEFFSQNNTVSLEVFKHINALVAILNLPEQDKIFITIQDWLIEKAAWDSENYSHSNLLQLIRCYVDEQFKDPTPATVKLNMLLGLLDELLQGNYALPRCAVVFPEYVTDMKNINKEENVTIRAAQAYGIIYILKPGLTSEDFSFYRARLDGMLSSAMSVDVKERMDYYTQSITSDTESQWTLKALDNFIKYYKDAPEFAPLLLECLQAQKRLYASKSGWKIEYNDLITTLTTPKEQSTQFVEKLTKQEGQRQGQAWEASIFGNKKDDSNSEGDDKEPEPQSGPV